MSTVLQERGDIRAASRRVRCLNGASHLLCDGGFFAREFCPVSLIQRSRCTLSLNGGAAFATSSARSRGTTITPSPFATTTSPAAA